MSNSDSDPNADAVRVKYMKPAAGDDSWVGLPEWMDGAAIYTEPDKTQTRPKDVSGREVLFDVLKPSTVLVIVSWSYDGNRNGGWIETRSKKGDLIKQGWIPISNVKRRTKGGALVDFIIFRQDCKAGQSFRFHSRKYNPPFVAMVSAARLAEVPTSNPVLSASNTMPEWPQSSESRWARTKADSETVVLTARDPDLKTESWGMLQRELVRQAVLLSAREELGLSTRDPMLRESSPATKNLQAPLEVIVTVTGDNQLKITVFVAGTDDWQILWDRQVPLPADTITLGPVLEQAELFSRTEFPAVLGKVGFRKKVRTAPGKTPLDADTRDLLDTFQLVAQFAAVRQLHSLIRTKGESPALLGGLARGYANLGVLCEPFWSPAQKVFKARALLYAQRSVTQFPDSPDPHVTQAYVWLLCGIHQLAQDSLAEAAQLTATGTSNEASSGDTPTELDVLEAGAVSDAKRLATFGETSSLRPLVRLLEFQAIEPTSQSILLNRHCGALLKEQPHSLRPLAAMAHHPQMGPKIEAVRQGFTRFPEGLYGSLELVPDVPTELLKLVEREFPRFKPGFDIAEIEIRKRLIQSLNEFGASEKDRGEPSLAVLGQLLLDVGFRQSIALLDYQTRSQGVDVDGSIPTHRSIAAGHPYVAYFETYASDPARVEVAMKQLVESIIPEALGNPERVMVDKVYYHHSKSKYNELVRYVDRHADPTLREIYLRVVHLDQKKYASIVSSMLKRLQKSCPDHPLTATLTARYDWPAAKPQAAEWEARFSDHPLVLYWLSEQYETTGDLEGAERCLSQGLKVTPDVESYTRLGIMHIRRGDFEKWKSTLDEMFLRTEAEGLEHAHAKHRIAWYLMRNQKFDEALPYAEAAADTYSAWGLECLSVCYEGLDRLEESESLLRAAANRYESHSLTWFKWCKRNGQGDHEAARRISLEYINGFSNSPSSDEMSVLAEYYLLTGDLKQSLENFQNLWKADKSVGAGTMAVILADQLKRHDDRDRLLIEIIKLRATYDEESGEREVCDLLKVVQDGLKGDRIDIKRADDAVSKGHSVTQDACNYFLARFLQTHGQTDPAKERMMKTATSPNVGSPRQRAMIWLRERKIPFGKPRPIDAPKDADRSATSKP